MALDSGPLPVANPPDVARTDFNDAMTQLNAAFPLQTVNIDLLQITTALINNLAVTAGKLGAEAVETAKIKLLAVTVAQLGAEAVERAKIKLLAVDTPQLEALAVTEAKIGALAVTAGKIGAEAVERTKIKLLAVDTPQIEALAVEEAKIGALAVSAAKLKADAVETLKIKDLNVTIAKAALGFGRYVQRLTNAWDKGVGDFTTDGTAQVNGLDLSGIVPAGATAVVLKVALLDGAANSYFYVYHSAGSTIPGIRMRTQVANIEYQQIGTIPIDSDRLMDYEGANLVFTGIDLAVIGWFT